MKNKVLFMAVAVLLMAGSWGAAVAQTIKVQVTNSSSTDRKDVPVVVDLKNVLGKKTAGVVSAMVTTPSLIGRAGGESVPSQLDDLDGDLIYDELAFVADIPAGSTQTFQVVLSTLNAQLLPLARLPS